MDYMDVRLFNKCVVYGISCDKDDIITRDRRNGSCVLYRYPYKEYYSGLNLSEKVKNLYYDNGRPLYKNEAKLFKINKWLSVPN